MTECYNDELDMSGVEQPLKLRAGDTFQIASTFTVNAGQTISAATMNVYDEDDAVALAGSAQISGLTVTWGLIVAASTALLDQDISYTYRLKITLSDGLVQTVYYGPLNIV